jgi:DNA-binding NarL/FixJ family response regulator
LQNLGAIDPQVMAIVSIGYSEHLIMADFQKYGVKGIIAKPYRFTELSKVLHDMIMGEDVEKL